MDRFTWGIAAGVLALVVAAVAVAAVERGRAVPPDLGTPAGVVLAYEQALQRGDAERAWELLSTTAQASTRKERFLTRAGVGRPRDDRVRLSVENQQPLDAETATVELVRSYTGSGGPFGFGGSGQSRTTVRLKLEGGQWRISAPPEPYLLFAD